MTIRPETAESLRRRFAARVEQRRLEQAPRIARAERLSAQNGLGPVLGLYAVEHRSSMRPQGCGIIAVSLIVGLATAELLLAGQTEVVRRP
jgi:hypothetical protein